MRTPNRATRFGRVRTPDIKEHPQDLRALASAGRGAYLIPVFTGLRPVGRRAVKSGAPLLAKSGRREDISHNLYTPPGKRGAFFS